MVGADDASAAHPPAIERQPEMAAGPRHGMIVPVRRSRDQHARAIDIEAAGLAGGEIGGGNVAVAGVQRRPAPPAAASCTGADPHRYGALQRLPGDRIEAAGFTDEAIGRAAAAPHAVGPRSDIAPGMCHRYRAGPQIFAGGDDGEDVTDRRIDADHVAVGESQRGEIGRVDVRRVGLALGCQRRQVAAGRIEAMPGAPRNQPVRPVRLGFGGGSITQDLARHVGGGEIETRRMARLRRRDHGVQVAVDAVPSVGRIGPDGARRDRAAGAHLVEEGRLVGHRVHGAVAAGQRQRRAEPLGKPPDHGIFVHQIARRRDQGAGIAGIGNLVPPFRQVGDVVALEAHAGGEHIIGAPGGLRHQHVDLDEKIEAVERGGDLVLIGEGDDRVAADRDQRADLPRTGRQDLVGEHVAGHFHAELGQPAKARGGEALAIRRHRRRDLRPAGAGGGEDARDRGEFAFVTEAPAKDVKALDEIFGQGAATRHLRPGAGAGDAPRAEREHAGGSDNLAGIDPGAIGRDLGCETVDGGGQCSEAIDMRAGEVAVVKPFADDDAQHPCEQRRVLAGLHRQMDMGKLGHVAGTWIGDDQLQSPRQRVAQPPRRREGWQAARRAIVRDDRIVADEERHVGGGEALQAALPATVTHPRIDLGGLIEGDAGIEVARPQPTGEGHRRADPGGVLESIGPGEDRDRIRAMGVDQSPQLRSDGIERRVAGNRREAVVVPRQARPQPVGTVVRLGELAALDAGVATEDRILGIAAHRRHATILDIGEHRAIGVAEPAEGAVGGVRHGGIPDRTGRLSLWPPVATVTFGGCRVTAVGHTPADRGKESVDDRAPSHGRTIMIRALGCRASILAIAAAIAVPAGAQTATPAATQVAAADAADSPDTIIVTATRQAIDKQKLGVSLTALGQEQLIALAPKTLLDLQGTAPNVFIGIGTAAPGQSAIFIRGQGYADVEKTQSPPVGVIQDGVFFGNNTGQLLDMFNVCSVEVDRGPQGIFYGKNTTAGLININRCGPTRKTGLAAEVGYGSFNEAYVRGVVNVPLGDKGGIAASGQYRRTDGYYNNIYTKQKAAGSDYYAFNLKLNYDLADWLNVDLNYDHIHETGGGTPVQFGNKLTASILFGANPGAIFPRYNPETGSPDGLKPREIENRPGADHDRLNTHIGSGILKAQTPIGELVSQTAYMDETDTVDQDFDGTCVTAPGCTTVKNPLLGGTGGFLQTKRDQTYKQFSEELRLSGKVGPVDYLLGAYYYNHKITLHQTTNSAIDQFSAEKDHSWSFFGNLDWNVTDTLKLSGGVRNIFEAKRFDTRYVLLGTIPLTPQIRDRRSWTNLITRFNAQWQATPDLLLYATRAEGFRSGGFSIRGTLSEQAAASNNCGVVGGCPGNNFLAYEPETNTTYEIGIKTRFADNAITFNADGFINDIDNFQQSAVVVTPGYGPGTNTYIVNFPQVRIKGLEFELDVNIGRLTNALEGLRLSGTVGIQDANVRNGKVNGQQSSIGPGAQAGRPGTTADFTGTVLQRVPSNNYTIRGTYSREVGAGKVTLTAGYSWIDSFSLGAFGTLKDIQPSYGLLDASATFDWKGYFVRVAGKNLTSKDYRTQSLPTVFFQGWAPPATFLVSAGAKF